MASVVRPRTREIGIRVALGATPSEVRRCVLRDALAVEWAGLMIGVGGAPALTRALGAVLFEVSPTDPVTFARVCAPLLAVATLAAYVPARRATRVDPVRALRAE